MAEQFPKYSYSYTNDIGAIDKDESVNFPAVHSYLHKMVNSGCFQIK